MRNRSGLHASFVLLALSLVGLGLVVAQPRGMPSHDGRLYPTFATPATHHAAASYSNLPLSFEANQGQTDAQVKFLSRGRGYTLFLAATEAVLTLKQASESSVVRMKLVGANPHAEVSGLEKLPGKSNYFIGNDPDKWRTNVPQYAKVRYENVYPGIDLVYYGTNQRQLEYDFVIAPGADPGRIRLRLEGANDLALDEKGNLIVHAGSNLFVQQRPVVYQESNAGKKLIESSYVVEEDYNISIAVSAYDTTKPLVIDPIILTYSTFLGGSGEEEGRAIEIDSGGNIIVTGITGSIDFPTTPGVIQTALAGEGTDACHSGTNRPRNDLFVTKLNPEGTQLLFSTFLGGSEGDVNWGFDPMAIDGQGNIYLTGRTCSVDFPTTAGSLQPGFVTGSSPGFVTKLDPTGSQLAYSTFLGGTTSDVPLYIVVDSDGNAYLTGTTRSTDFPTTAGSFQPACVGPEGSDAFVAKLNPAGSALIYATCLGGTTFDEGLSLSVNGQGEVTVAGVTQSSDFPTVNALQNTLEGLSDVFISTLSVDGSTLLFSTYLGGTETESFAQIIQNSNGFFYLVGMTSSADFPVVGAIQPTIGTTPQGTSSQDLFVVKIDPTIPSLVFSTFLGGNGTDGPIGFIFDENGNLSISGWTTSTNFPLASPLQGIFGGGLSDAFVTKLSPDGSALIYSTYLGGSGQDFAYGITTDASGNVFITGSTTPEVDSFAFPTVSPLQATLKGTGDAFVAKIIETATNPLPSPADLTPAEAVAGSSQLTLIVNGTDFVPESVVQWNGADRATTFVRFDRLEAAIPATDLAFAEIVTVTVFNPSPGGGASSDLIFTIGNPVPTLTSLAPTTVTAGDTGFTLSVTGTNFVRGSVVEWNGQDRTTTFVSDTLLEAVIPASDLTVGGAFPVTVFNPAPLGGTSNAGTFIVQGNPLPSISSISPGSTPVGGPAFTLTINGMGFAADSVVRWNGQDRTTVFVSDTQLTANILAADIATVGTTVVSVFSPAPGGGLSNEISFTVEGAEVSLSNTTVNFDRQIIGASSLPVNILLTNSGNLPLTIFSVLTTQDFGHVNACTSQVNPGITCEIDVFFQPSTIGSVAGTLTIDHDAANSPLVVDLLGEGIEIQIIDTGGPKSITAGQVANFTISVQSTGGTGENVALGITNLPPFSNATFSQPNVTADDNAPVNVTVSVATTKGSSVLPLGHPSTPWPGLVLILVVLLSIAIWLSVKSVEFRPQKLYVGAVLALFMLGAMAGCGGGNSTSPPSITVPGTPPGVYSIVVTGTVTLGGTTTEVNTTLTLTVQ